MDTYANEMKIEWTQKKTRKKNDGKWYLNDLRRIIDTELTYKYTTVTVL